MSLFSYWPKVKEFELISSSFKFIVLLPQTKVPHGLRSESSALSRLMSTGVSNSQTLYFRNKEVDLFLTLKKSMEPSKSQFP